MFFYSKNTMCYQSVKHTLFRFPFHDETLRKLGKWVAVWRPGKGIDAVSTTQSPGSNSADQSIRNGWQANIQKRAGGCRLRKGEERTVHARVWQAHFPEITKAQMIPDNISHIKHNDTKSRHAITTAA